MSDRIFGSRTDLAPVEGDPDLGDLTGGVEPEDQASDLATIEAELAAEEPEDAGLVRIDVPNRPGYVLVCRGDFSHRDIDLLRKKAKDRKFSDGYDSAKYAGLLIGTMCVRVDRHGAPLDFVGAMPFASRELQAMLKSSGVLASVLAMFGRRDNRVIAAANLLMTEAGWEDEAALADPTQ